MTEVKREMEVLISVLAHTYEQIFLLDNNSEGGTLFKGEERVEVSDYNSWCSEFYTDCYAGDDYVHFLKKISKENVKKTLEEETEYIVAFSVGGDNYARKQLRAFWTDEGNILCICVADITKEFEQRQFEKTMIRDAMDLAYESICAKECFYESVQEDIKIPLGMLREQLQIVKDSTGEKQADSIDKAVGCLNLFSEYMEQTLLMAEKEKYRFIPQKDVIYIESFQNEIKNKIEAGVESAKKEHRIKNLSPQVAAFVADKRRLEQILFFLLRFLEKNQREEKRITGEMFFQKAEDEEPGLFRFTLRLKAGCVDVSSLQENEKQMLLILQRMATDVSANLQLQQKQDETEVFFSMPVEVAEEKTVRRLGVVQGMIDSGMKKDFSRYRALVVDDDRLRRELIVVQLERLGLAVDVASDGQETLDIISGSPLCYYDILFLNPILPTKSGYDVVMELRDMKRNDINDMSVVAYTTKEARDQRIQALEHGMDYHLILPFNERELKEILMRELDNVGPDDDYEAFGFRVIK